MNFTRSACALTLFLALAAWAGACPPSEEDLLQRRQFPAAVARAHLSAEDLRAMGPTGLAAVLAEHDEIVKAGGQPSADLLARIDAVAGQKDAAWSRLYWYTDLDAAKAAAKESHKPILYLRMLGKLTDEYSCANSRFFRTALYANENVSKFLREQFVLVWGSERPVPVVTIDMGDGRVLKRTITGNSAHYVLSPDGAVVDVLPGLFDPASFAGALASARGAALTYSPESARRYAMRGEDALLRQWQNESQALANTKDEKVAAWVAADAVAAQRRATSKAFVEMPMLAAISPEFSAAIARTATDADGATWAKVAALHPATLDAHSIALMRTQNPGIGAAALAGKVAAFQKTIADDTVHNNFLLRRQVLAWLKDAKEPVALEDLNRRVYAELFLTPRSDAWLGLVNESTYSALDCDGRCEPQVVSEK